MANNDINDKELNDYLNGDSDVSKAYRSSNKTEPSAGLDKKILLAAKESVENTVQKREVVFHKSPWVRPVSIAAIVTLSVSLVVTMQHDTGQPLISEPEIEMFDSAVLIEEKIMPQPKTVQDGVSVTNKVEKNQHKNERVDMDVSAPTALGAIADAHRTEEKAIALKDKLRERPVRKMLLKEKANIETLEGRTFAEDMVLPPESVEAEFDAAMDIKQGRQLDKTTREVDLVSEIIKLIETGKNNLFVYIGKTTKNKLMSRKNILKECSITVEEGDADSPIGNGKATNVAYIYCPNEKTLGLRLRKDDNKYHIIGYWTFM